MHCMETYNVWVFFGKGAACPVSSPQGIFQKKNVPSASVATRFIRKIFFHSLAREYRHGKNGRKKLRRENAEGRELQNGEKRQRLYVRFRLASKKRQKECFIMNWYNSLTTPEKIYFYIAIVGTALLVIQIVMMLFFLRGRRGRGCGYRFRRRRSVRFARRGSGHLPVHAERYYVLPRHRRLDRSAHPANQSRKYPSLHHSRPGVRTLCHGAGGARHERNFQDAVRGQSRQG